MYPYLNYCNSIWGNTFQTYLEPLVKLQKRAIRIISSADRRAHTEPLFRRLAILNLPKLYVYCAQLFMFKFHHCLVPEIFQNFFQQNSSLHSYSTRQANHLHSFSANTLQKRKSLRTIGVNIYNYFIDKLDMNCLFMTYKYHLKKFLVDNEVRFLIE